MATILDPTDERTPIQRTLTVRPEAITGTVALLDISKPRGDVLINGGKHAVVSFDGGWIDADSRIEVKTYRNGLPCVGLLVPASEECEPPKE